MTTRREGFMVLMAVGLVIGWAGAGVAVGATPAEKCEVKKLKAAGKKTQCLLKEEEKEVLGDTPDPTACSDKFMGAFAGAEANAGPGICTTEGDAAAVEAQIDACVANLAAALSNEPPPFPCPQFPATGQTTCWDPADTSFPFSTIGCAGTGHDGEIQAGATLSYTDNGDGTITDNNTGLMWEKLCDEDPPGATCPAEHDVDTTYTWANAFAVKIAALNTVPCFAGYCDWRVPNVKEFMSIENYENFNPSVSPAFNTGCVASCTVLGCSCTGISAYWSSTSTTVGGEAWVVHFSDGTVSHDPKDTDTFVRAVRDGL